MFAHYTVCTLASRPHVFVACRKINDLLDRSATNDDKQSIALLRVAAEKRCLRKRMELVGIALSNIGFVQGGSKSSSVTFAVKLVGVAPANLEISSDFLVPMSSKSLSITVAASILVLVPGLPRVPS